MSTWHDHSSNPALALQGVTSQAIRNYYHLSKTWKFLLLSLPLDILTFFLLIQLRDSFPSNLPNELSLSLLGGLAVVSIFREQVIAALLRGYHLYKKLDNTRQNYSFLLMAAVAFFLLIDITVKVYRAFGELAVVAIIALSVLVFPRWYASIRSQQREAGAGAIPSRLMRALQTNRFIFRANLGLVVTMRVGIVVTVALAALTNGEIGLLVAIMAAAGVMFYNIQPEQQDFIAQCRRCARPTASVFRKEGSCPTCEQQRYRDAESRRERLEHEARTGFNLDKVDRLIESFTFGGKSKKVVHMSSAQKRPKLSLVQVAEQRLFERDRKKAVNS